MTVTKPDTQEISNRIDAVLYRLRKKLVGPHQEEWFKLLSFLGSGRSSMIGLWTTALPVWKSVSVDIACVDALCAEKIIDVVPSEHREVWHEFLSAKPNIHSQNGMDFVETTPRRLGDLFGTTHNDVRDLILGSRLAMLNLCELYLLCKLCFLDSAALPDGIEYFVPFIDASGTFELEPDRESESDVDYHENRNNMLLGFMLVKQHSRVSMRPVRGRTSDTLNRDTRMILRQYRDGDI